MKTKIIDKDIEWVLSRPSKKHIKPKRINMFFRTLLKLVSMPDLIKTHFKYERVGMERLKKGESAIVLMNHSSFIDLEILATLMYPRPFNIMTTTDAFVGMEWLLRQIGCIPTKKFIHDMTLIRDMKYCINELKSSVVIFPEASYSFDGTATPIPDTVAKLIKTFAVPVIMIRTFGAFARDPLYNNIQVRPVDVSARQEYLLSKEDIEGMSVEEIDAVLKEQFSFDNCKWQQENRVRIDAPTRADFLNRVLYKCPHCMSEGNMEGKGIRISCQNCGKSYILDEYGYLVAEQEGGLFTHIPDWYAWEREQVKKEVEDGSYRLDVPVDVYVTLNTEGVYRVGEGRLVHSQDGFVLDGCDGRLHYEQKPLFSYSLYSDFNWYEIGDVIAVGDKDVQYYCFPKGKEGKDVVAKARLAQEELFKLLSK